MSHARKRCLPAISALSVLGCGALWQSAGLAAESPAAAPETPTASDVRDTDGGKRAVERAQKALESQRQWIDGLTLESVTEQQWPDSSLGCRRPGSSYLQVIKSGYAVKFAGKDARREVHVSGDNAVVCTELASLQSPPMRQRVPLRQLDAMLAAARTDLASKLGAKPDAVTVANWEPVHLAAPTLHCEPGAEQSTDPAVPGYKILLNYQGRTFRYYSDLKTAIACPAIELN